jgi:hypothetical protein
MKIRLFAGLLLTMLLSFGMNSNASAQPGYGCGPRYGGYGPRYGYRAPVVYAPPVYAPRYRPRYYRGYRRPAPAPVYYAPPRPGFQVSIGTAW